MGLDSSRAWDTGPGPAQSAVCWDNVGSGIDSAMGEADSMAVAVLASGLDTLAEVAGAISIVIGFVAVGVLWWLMVARPSRRERARRKDSRRDGRHPR